MRSFFLLLGMACGLSPLIHGQSVTRLDGSTLSFKDLDRKIEQLAQAAQVHGMAVSIFNQREPVYTRTFGYKRLDTKEPIGPESNMYGASLSKAVFAVLVLKLVEERVITLDRPLQDYLPKPIYDYPPKARWHDHYEDLKEDTAYRKITARMCLSHTTGFPNWRSVEPDGKLRLKFPPGDRYLYSGEGMVYLQVVLEHLTGKPLDTLMRQKVFGPLGMTHSAYTFLPRFEKDYVVGHQPDGKLYDKDKDNEARAPSTLETTVEDYVRFTRAVLQGSLLKPASMKELFTPQVRIRTIQQFGDQRDTTAWDNIRLSYGLGWGLLRSPHGTGAFKEGHGDGFQHYSILFPEKGTGIVIMTNSDNGESIFKELLELTIGDVWTPWYWENY
ncbi:MAG TPA: serine hydrolase domain-containing protein, partial [Chitinophagaceae bacterium]|nr:serine hydrolase domain-containing protein [Chitinophagaceae bacterium]